MIKDQFFMQLCGMKFNIIYRLESLLRSWDQLPITACVRQLLVADERMQLSGICSNRACS